MNVLLERQYTRRNWFVLNIMLLADDNADDEFLVSRNHTIFYIPAEVKEIRRS